MREGDKEGKYGIKRCLELKDITFLLFVCFCDGIFCYLRFEFLRAPEEGKEGGGGEEEKGREEVLTKHTSELVAKESKQSGM